MRSNRSSKLNNSSPNKHIHKSLILLLALLFSTSLRSNAQNNAFIEENGLVVIETEALDPVGDWVVETSEAGYTGNGYLRWSGPDYLGDPDIGTLEYKVIISDPGDYNVRIRMSHLGAPAGDAWNDCWSRMNDSGPWHKTLHPSAHQNEGFTFNSILEPSGGQFASMRYTLDAGEHTFYISGRSNNFKMDRIHFFKDDVQDPLSTSYPQSARVSGDGGTDGGGGDGGSGDGGGSDGGTNITPANITISGEQKLWHPISLTIDGPQADENSSPNPFLDYRLSVTFSQGAHQYVVPGYFAADGNAAETSATSGNKWRVHFTPDRIGTWNYEVNFRSGSDIALNLDLNSGTPTPENGLTGSLFVSETDKSGRDHRSKGVLRYVGEHYLRFDNGDYFIKGGADSPENFLAYGEFDGTYNHEWDDNIKSYSAHIGDWRNGDPTWQQGKGKGIIGAINYLASEGMNSIYFITNNINGDGRDVWPWTSPNERFRFDVSKLDQWNLVFDHMDQQGIMLHVLTQETENERLLDGGALGRERRAYFRELVARFSHHHALTWNLGEENDENTDAQRKEFASYIRALDPYDHHIVIHTYPYQYDQVYNPLLGYPDFEGTSLQISDIEITHNETIKWRERSTQNGRPWIVSLDELGPWQTGVTEDGPGNNHDTVRKYALWANYMAGGAGVEWYFGYETGSHDLNAEDWRTRDNMWNFTRYALEFFHNYLPFDSMEPAGQLTANNNDYVFAQSGVSYAVYLPNGGNVDIDLASGDYQVQWYNPRQGGALVDGAITTVSGGGVRSIGSPPYDQSQDWVALIRSGDGGVTTGSPSLSLSQTNLDFGSLQPGATQTLPLTLTNSGDANLFVSSLSVDGNESIFFEIASNPTPVTLSPGQSTTTNIVFAPGSGTPSTKNATLRINSDDPARGVINVALQGTLSPNGGTGDDGGNNGGGDNGGGGNNGGGNDDGNNGGGNDGGDAETTSIQVTSFTLIDASTGREIRDIENGETIVLSDLPSPYINIRANTIPEQVGSVQFSLNSNTNFHLENSAPYAMAGDIGDAYNAWAPVSGEHTLIARPFTDFNGAGEQGLSLEVTFSVLDADEIPSTIHADQNYPNPFTSSTSITFTLDQAGETRLIVYDITGREVTRLVDRLMPAGTFTVPLDGSTLRSGSYFYRLESNGEIVTKTMQVVK